MDIFTSGIFWFIEGILFCLILMGIRAWAEDRDVPMPAWKWALVAAWLLYCGFTQAFIGTCLGEEEHQAAIRGGAMFGVLAVIAGVGIHRLLLLRPKEKPAPEEQQAEENG